MTKLIEQSSVERAYGINGCEAVIDHPKHGRILIIDGYGGEDNLDGGTVRWRHGLVAQLKESDTLTALKDEAWNEGMSRFDAVVTGYDPDRPLLNWDGSAVESVAESAGL